MKWSSFIADGAQQQNSTHVTSNPRATLNYWKDWLNFICNLVSPAPLFISCWTISDEGHLVLFQFQWIIDKVILNVKYGFVCHLYV